MRTRAQDTEAQAYYAQGHWRREDLWQDFEAVARAVPDKPALVCRDETLTFGEVRHAAAALSARLSAEGIGRGDVVGLCGRHSIEAVVAMLACVHRGTVLALVPPLFGEEQVRALLRQTGARALIGFGTAQSVADALAVADAVPLV